MLRDCPRSLCDPPNWRACSLKQASFGSAGPLNLVCRLKPGADAWLDFINAHFHRSLRSGSSDGIKDFVLVRTCFVFHLIKSESLDMEEAPKSAGIRSLSATVQLRKHETLAPFNSHIQRGCSLSAPTDGIPVNPRKWPAISVSIIDGHRDRTEVSMAYWLRPTSDASYVTWVLSEWNGQALLV